MQAGESHDCRNPSHEISPTWMAAVFRAVLRVFARGLFEILRVFQPLVLPTLFWLAAGGVALWVVFVKIAHDDGFPTASVLLMSLGCLLGAMGYCVLLESLRPMGR